MAIWNETTERQEREREKKKEKQFIRKKENYLICVLFSIFLCICKTCPWLPQFCISSSVKCLCCTMMLMNICFGLLVLTILLYAHFMFYNHDVYLVLDCKKCCGPIQLPSWVWCYRSVMHYYFKKFIIKHTVVSQEYIFCTDLPRGLLPELLPEALSSPLLWKLLPPSSSTWWSGTFATSSRRNLYLSCDSMVCFLQHQHRGSNGQADNSNSDDQSLIKPL